MFIGEEDLIEKETSEENKSHHDTRGSYQGLSSAAQKAKYPEVLVGKTDQKAVKKAPELVKCPKVTFPMVEKIKRSDTPQGKWVIWDW